MQVKEIYQLFFQWKGLKYNGDVATFKKAWFSGPVLQIAAKINPDTYMDLDFTRQNLDTKLFLPSNFYIARLRWKEVEYKDGDVTLKGCVLQHNKSGSLRELKNGLRFLIDCSGHDERIHHKMLVYPAWVLNPEDIIK
jgi:hypothetical protein